MTTQKLIWLLSAAIFFGMACANNENPLAERPTPPEPGGSGRGMTASQPVAEGPDGAAVFRQYCVTCHGADGKLGLNGAKDLSQSPLTREQRIQIITNGKNMMTPFGEMLSPEEIRAVADYTLTFKSGK